MVQGYLSTRRIFYTFLLRLPGVRDKVQLQIAEAKINLEKRLVPSGPGVERHLRLPIEGWSDERVREELQKLSDMKHTKWEDGRVSGAVYHGGEKLVSLQTEAFGMFSVSNPIHPDVFPGVRKMEAEIVAMVRRELAWDQKLLTKPRTGPFSFPCPGDRCWCYDEWRNRVHFIGLLKCKTEGLS